MTVNTPIGKITASKDTLNKLSCYIHRARMHCVEKDLIVLAFEAEEIAHAIYEDLELSGYYDDVE